MERDKLNEALKDFIRKNRSIIGNDAPLVADAFEACAEAVMKMPLSDCLTEEDKTKIKTLYSKMELDGNHVDSDNNWVV
ncbi:MAG: hypothetical protein K2N34_06240 [Lachnospiraceae bacterium]|nr:hypothetical protein [Lachnospiraceae bacterium]